MELLFCPCVVWDYQKQACLAKGRESNRIVSHSLLHHVYAVADMLFWSSSLAKHASSVAGDIFVSLMLFI